MAGGKKMVNIRLDSELWRKIKLQAVAEGKTLQAYVAEVLENVVANYGKVK